MLSELLAEAGQLQPGRKSHSDPFFAASDALCGPYSLLGIVDLDIEPDSSWEFVCEVHGCTEKLASLAELEQHYNTFHRFECGQCKKHLASAHLLDLHLCEAHDSFFQLQAQKKPMFSCFVAECESKSWDGAERMAHCVAAHDFPVNFRFDSAAPPKKPQATMELDTPPPKPPKKKKKKPSAESAAAAPPVLGGGGRRGRGRLQPGWHQRIEAPRPQQPSVIEMHNLEDALNAS